MDKIQNILITNADDAYRKFQCKLIPEIPPERIIGVRMPALKKIASDLYGIEEAENFMSTLPHFYYDENNLHAFLIMKEKDFGKALLLTEKFLPHIDNWATCDSFKPRVFSKSPETLLPYVYRWTCSSHPFTVRYGIKFLMDYFLDVRFDPKYLDLIAKIRSENYYVKMAEAWFFSFALIKKFDETVEFFEKGLPDRFVQSKSIQKAVESYRLDSEKKEYLKTLKRIVVHKM